MTHALDDIAGWRLDLRPATIATLEAALDGPAALAAATGAQVPASWPPEFLDEAALTFTRDRLREHPDEADWWMHVLVLREGAGAQPLLAGTAGYKGPPDADGTVEIGYSVVTEHRRRGLATAAARALVERAFACRDVRRVIAETLPDLVGSQGVLEKCGFRLAGAGSEAGVIRYELPRTVGRGV